MGSAITGRSAWLILPALLLLAVFFLLPLGNMVKMSFDADPVLAHYTRLVSTPIYMRIAVNTFVLALVVTLICLVLGYPLAYLLASVPVRLRRLLIVPIMVPYLTSLMVRSYAWMVLLGREGLINEALSLVGLGPVRLLNTTFATYVGMVHVMLPLMVLPLFAAMVNIDKRLVTAAKGLGAPPYMAFFRVYLPLSIPGIAAGSCLVFIISLGFFIIPALLGGTRDQTLATLIERQVDMALNWEFAAALGMLLFVLTMLLLGLGLLLGRLVTRALHVK